MALLRPCPTARLLRRGRALVAGRGLAEVELASGPRTSRLRCAQWGGRLVVLAPRPTDLTARLEGDQDEAGVVRFRSGIPAVGPEDWLAVDVIGWVSSVPAPVQRAAALEFSERHPTVDLLDLAHSWALLSVDVAEVHVAEATARDGVRETVLDADSATAWLAAA